MLVNVYRDTKVEHARLLVCGVLFLGLVAGLLGLSIAVYNKTFDTVTMVTIKADRAGLQLAKFGDVRLNGVLVGQVREISQDGEEAEIKVALEPDAAREIPRNVEVEILPTTLFGQKFISFVRPAFPSPEAIAADAVIPSSRVETNVELSQILSDLFPLLRAVRPADLNATLNALATALEGRGDQLGETLVDLGTFADTIEGSLPTLREDLVKLADVADTYDLAAPDLLDVLGDLTVTSRTVLDKEQQLETFFTDVTGLSDTTRRVLGDNESALIRVGEVSEPVLKLLSTYSPEFPCLITGAARYAPVLASTFEGNQVKQFLEIGTAQYGAYTAEDLPEYGEVGHGPWCAGLPSPPVPIGPQSFDDGTDIDDDPPTGKLPDLTNLLPEIGLDLSELLTGLGLARPAPAYDDVAPAAGFGDGMSSGYTGTAAEQTVLNALLAGESGRSADSYGAWGSLLYGPVVRGSGDTAEEGVRR